MKSFRKKAAKNSSSQLTKLGIKNAQAQLRLVRALKSVREQHGISVQEVADSMGVDASMVYRFEQGGTNFTMSTLRSYADAVDAMIELVAYPARESIGSERQAPVSRQEFSWSSSMHLESTTRVPKRWKPRAASSITQTFKASL